MKSSSNPTIVVNTDHLDDDEYMECITDRPSWAALDRYFRSMVIMELMGQLRELPDDTQQQVFKVLTANMSAQERRELYATEEASKFLDTLVVALKAK